MNRRIAELDGIRAIAILMVIVWHYVACQPKILTPGSLGFYLHLPTTAFWSGVDLFFVLSGFLIGGNILDNGEKKSFLRVFWIRRICRIFPVLFLLLFVCWISSAYLDSERFAWLYNDLMPWWTYISFTQNIAMGLDNSFGGHFLGVTWSLAVEEQFYLFAPILIVACGKKTWIRSLVPLIVLALILRLLFPGFHTHVNTVFRMDSLLLGALVATIYRKEGIWQYLLLNRALVVAFFIIFSSLSLGSLVFFDVGEVKFSLFAIVYSSFLVVVLLYRSSRLTWILRTKILGFWGSIAYGLYMYHQAISGLLHGWLRNGASPSLVGGFAASITGAAFVLSVLVAWISYIHFESVFLKLGRRQHYGEHRVLNKD